MLRRTFLTVSLITTLRPRSAWGAPLPSWDQVLREIRTYFGELKDYQAGDLLSRREVAPLFAILAQIGWKVSDQPEIMKLVLPDGHFLVNELRHTWGRPLMRRMASINLLYDKLDRVSQVEGGQTLIHDLAKLPDAPQAIGYLPDLLAKKVGGRTRKVADYDKPTGMLYTEKLLVARLEKSYRDARSSQVVNPIR